MTKRSRKPGETCELASLSGDFYVSARVIYCERLPNGNYCVGLKLRHSQPEWWHGSRAIRTALEERSSRAELDVAV